MTKLTPKERQQFGNNIDNVHDTGFNIDLSILESFINGKFYSS